MRSRVSGTFSVHVELHSRIKVLSVSGIEAVVFTYDDVKVVWHKQYSSSQSIYKRLGRISQF